MVWEQVLHLVVCLEAGVANTLRRKMFKLGGEVNTHGVGITSGLEYRRPGYNKGGEVTTPIGVGSGKQPMVPGPDGKLREGHVGPVVGGIGNLLALGIPKLLSPMARRYGYKGAQQISKALADPKKSAFYKDLIKKGGNKAGIKALARHEGIQRVGMLNKALTLGAPALYGTGVATALGERAGVIDPERSNLEKYGTMASQGALDYLSLPGYGGMIAQSALDEPGDEDAKIRTLSDFLSGRENKTEEEKPLVTGGMNLGETSEPMQTAQTQEEQFAKMKADADMRAEMYYNMLSEGGPDKVRALGDAFTAAGAMYDEDKSQALAGFKGGIDQELDRDAALRDESKRLAVNDIVTQDATTKQDLKAREQMVEQAKLAIMTSPDMTAEQRSSTVVALNAYGQGIIDLLPTNDKQDDMDRTGMRPGTVYLDITGVTDGKYVAVSSNSEDPNQVDSFNSIPKAKAHAAS